MSNIIPYPASMFNLKIGTIASGTASPAYNLLLASGSFTLPPIAGTDSTPALPDGFVLWIKASAGVTVTPSGTDTLETNYTALTSAQAMCISVYKVAGTPYAWRGLQLPQ